MHQRRRHGSTSAATKLEGEDKTVDVLVMHVARADERNDALFRSAARGAAAT